MPELGPLPPPAGPTPGTGFPDPAAPGRPPPPLPGGETSDPPPPDPWGPLLDPAPEGGLTGLSVWASRLRVDPARGWSTITLLRASAPRRRRADPAPVARDESPMTLTAGRYPADALPSAPTGTDLLSRLRVVHRKLLPAAQRPADASWQQLGGRPAVLDRLTEAGGDRMSGFSLAAALGTDDGLAVVGWSPPGGAGTLEQVGLPLATLLRPDGDGLVWARLPSWFTREELQITGPPGSALAGLETLAPGTDLEGWTSVVLARGPLLGNLQPLGERPVSVRGVDQARLWTFTRQAEGRGRVLTAVVTGIAGDDGFSLVADVPFEGAELRLDLDAVLARVDVRPARATRSFPAPPPLALPSWPAELPGRPPAPPSLVPDPPPMAAVDPAVRSTATYGLPPVPPPRPRPSVRGRPRLRGPRDPYLDAAVDRVMVAAVDIADADPGMPAVPRLRTAGRPSSPVDQDVAAVRTVVDAILMRGWVAPLPWHGRMDVEAMAIARVGRWRRIADLLVAATRVSTGTDLDDEVWGTARLVATAAAAARADRTGERRGLAGVLERVRRGLEDPDGAWDDSVATVLVARPPRYRLATGFDGGSGHLLWAANDAARDRWNRSVDHFDLPVPLTLARQVQSLLDRFDLDHPDTGRRTRRFTQHEFVDFREEYLLTVDELRRALGPAYVIEERGPGRPA